MEKTVKINDIEYIEKSEYDKVNLKLTDYYVPDMFNVMAIIPPKVCNIDEINDKIEVKDFGNYKKVNLKEIYLQYDNGQDIEIIKVRNSRYSYEFIKKAKNIALRLKEDSKGAFYQKIDDNGEYIDNEPLLINFDGLIIILAPRVENE